jgi:hypothetical protein
VASARTAPLRAERPSISPRAPLPSIETLAR